MQVASSPIINNIARPFTCSAWVRIDGWYDNLWASFFNKSGPTQAVDSVQLHFQIRKTGTPYSFAPWICSFLSGGVVPTTSNWFHFTVVQDVTDIRLYINGELKNTFACSAPVVKNNHPLLLGSDPPGAQEYLIGAMDEFRMYNRALTAEEVLLLQ